MAGAGAQLHVFGSRQANAARGSELNLMLELNSPVENPALLAARPTACASRVLQGRKVDVLISAPNLQRQLIHDIAYREGQLIWLWMPNWVYV